MTFLSIAACLFQALPVSSCLSMAICYKLHDLTPRTGLTGMILAVIGGGEVTRYTRLFAKDVVSTYFFRASFKSAVLYVCVLRVLRLRMCLCAVTFNKSGA